MLVAEMLAKLFKRKAEKEGIPDSPDLRAAFLHEVGRQYNRPKRPWKFLGSQILSPEASVPPPFLGDPGLGLHPGSSKPHNASAAVLTFNAKCDGGLWQPP